MGNGLYFNFGNFALLGTEALIKAARGVVSNSYAKYLDRDSIYEFEEWKKSCEDKWKAECGLSYFKMNGVGVYQVSPKKSD
jgi:hypothetical protein